jgi:hypothetical protein
MSIEAMKQALEALEAMMEEFKSYDLPYGSKAYAKAKDATIGLRQAIAEAKKQEPVAWGFQNTAITGSNRWMMLREEVPANDQYGGALWTPLYTTPQPQQASSVSSIQSDKTSDAEKRHYCPEWDFLEITKDDPEFEACLCFSQKPDAWVADVGEPPTEEEKQEPWQWNDAPIKTQWGQDMVVADLEIDKDHTVSVYCERDQTKNVEAMFVPQPQREWVGLTHDERGRIWNAPENFERAMNFAIAIEAKLKEKNI